jgi:hypothetical protein
MVMKLSCRQLGCDRFVEICLSGGTFVLLVCSGRYISLESTQKAQVNLRVGIAADSSFTPQPLIC